MNHVIPSLLKDMPLPLRKQGLVHLPKAYPESTQKHKALKKQHVPRAKDPKYHLRQYGAFHMLTTVQTIITNNQIYRSINCTDWVARECKESFWPRNAVNCDFSPPVVSIFPIQNYTTARAETCSLKNGWAQNRRRAAEEEVLYDIYQGINPMNGFVVWQTRE